MTQYADIIQSLTTGATATVSAPTGISGFTFDAPAGSASFISSTVIDIGGGVKVIETKDTGWGASQAMFFDAPGNIAANTETEILVKWRSNSVASLPNNWLYFTPAMLRVPSGRSTWYSVGALGNAGSYSVRPFYMQSASEWNYLGSAKAVALTSGAWWWTRLHVTAAGVWSGRTWADGGSEPSDDFSGTTDTTVTSGYAGFGGFQLATAGALQVGYFSVGTNGDPAPSAGGSSPAITDVDTDEDVYDGQSNVAITGTNLSGATFDLIDGSITSSQNVDSTTSTTAQIDISMGNCRYGTRTLRATVGADTGTISITLSAPSGKSYINVGTPNTTAANRITAVSDLASGDQLEISNVVGGTIGDVTINADATFDVAIGVTAFDVRVNDGTGWGTIGTQTMLNGAAAGVGISNYLKTPKRRRNGGLAWALTSSEWF